MTGIKNKGFFSLYVIAVMWYIFMSESIVLRPMTSVAWSVFAFLSFFLDLQPSGQNVSKQVHKYFVLAAVFLLTCLYSLDSFQSMRYLLSLIMFFFVAYSITNTKEKVDVVLRVCLCFCLFLGSVTFIQILLPGTYISVFLPFLPFKEIVLLFMESGDMCGFTNQTGINAFWMVLGLGLSFFLFEKKNVLKYTIAILFFAALLTTGRRGPTVIAALVLLLFGFESGLKNLWKRILLIILSITLLTFLSDYIPYISNVTDKFEELSAAENLLNGRDTIFKYMIERVEENPLFGHGLNSFAQYMETSGLQILFSHNAYLQYVLEVGIIGTFFVCIMLFSPVIKGVRFLRKKNKEDNKVRLCLFVQLFLIIWGVVESAFYDQYRFFLLMVFQLSMLTLMDKCEDSERIEKCPEQIKR